MDATKLERIAYLKNQIKQFEDEIKEINQELALANLEPGVYVEGKAYAKITPNTRWDPTKALEFAQETYPLGENGENAGLYKVEVSVIQDVAKKMFPAEDYAQCVKHFANKVEVGIA